MLLSLILLFDSEKGFPKSYLQKQTIYNYLFTSGFTQNLESQMVFPNI